MMANFEKIILEYQVRMNLSSGKEGLDGNVWRDKQLFINNIVLDFNLVLLCHTLLNLTLTDTGPIEYHSKYIYVYIYIHAYTHIYICIYIYINIHTYIHFINF